MPVNVCYGLNCYKVFSPMTINYFNCKLSKCLKYGNLNPEKQISRCRLGRSESLRMERLSSIWLPQIFGILPRALSIRMIFAR